jgi:hypothetical protein
VSGGTYSIVILARLDQVTSYARLIDFANGTSDAGLYFLGGSLALYPDASATSTALVQGGQYAQVALTRDAAGMVRGYIGATQVLGPYDDSASNDAVVSAADVLRFFIDDAAVGGEDSGGAVARIRIYDGPLSAGEVASLAPAPPPVLGASEVAGVVSGTVRIAVPGGKFVSLQGNQNIPVGSTVDTRHGTVALQSAVDSAGKTQTGRFTGAIFKLGQSRASGARGLTTLDLKGGGFGVCPSAKGRSGPGATAGESGLAQTVRRLQGRAHGHFRTRGRYAAATVRGTIWTIADRCDGTLTSVRRGVVSVLDLPHHRTVLVKAGHSYLARP